MKLIIAILMLTNFAFAVQKITLNTECYKMSDPVDKKYCQDKKMSILKSNYNNQASSWKKKKLDKKTKSKEQSKINTQIAQKSEQLLLLQEELKLLKANKTTLAKAKTKKKKKGDGIEAELQKLLKKAKKK